MSESLEDGAPFFFATQEPPSATAIDDDIYLTVTTAMPAFPGHVETIDIILSLRDRATFARRSAGDRKRRSLKPRRVHSSSSAVVSVTRRPGQLSEAAHSRPCSSAIAATRLRPSPVPAGVRAASAR